MRAPAKVSFSKPFFSGRKLKGDGLGLKEREKIDNQPKKC
jgi:hypothetical protein